MEQPKTRIKVSLLLFVKHLAMGSISVLWFKKYSVKVSVLWFAENTKNNQVWFTTLNFFSRFLQTITLVLLLCIF